MEYQVKFTYHMLTQVGVWGQIKAPSFFVGKFTKEFLDVKNERKTVSTMWENAYLSIKNPKDFRALK